MYFWIIGVIVAVLVLCIVGYRWRQHRQRKLQARQARLDWWARIRRDAVCSSLVTNIFDQFAAIKDDDQRLIQQLNISEILDMLSELPDDYLPDNGVEKWAKFVRVASYDAGVRQRIRSHLKNDDRSWRDLLRAYMLLDTALPYVVEPLRIDMVALREEIARKAGAYLDDLFGRLAYGFDKDLIDELRVFYVERVELDECEHENWFQERSYRRLSLSCWSHLHKVLNDADRMHWHAMRWNRLVVEYIETPSIDDFVDQKKEYGPGELLTLAAKALRAGDLYYAKFILALCAVDDDYRVEVEPLRGELALLVQGVKRTMAPVSDIPLPSTD